MVRESQLKNDKNLETKVKIFQTLTAEGQIDKLKASLRSEVIRVLENEKKKSFGGASKYLK